MAHKWIAAETTRYDELLGGKGKGATSHHPCDLPVFGPPSIARVTPHNQGALGIVPEGSREPVYADEVCPPALPSFNPYVDYNRFLDIYNRGRKPIEWTASASEFWVTLSATEGRTDGTHLRA